MSRVARPVTTSTLALLLTLLFGVPVLAADEAKVSWDGIEWFDHIEGNLLQPPARWVPGDEAAGSFLILNNSRDPAAVTVEIAGDGTGLVSSGYLTLAVRVGDADWHEVAPADSFTLGILPARATTQVTVRGVFDAAAPNSSQELAGDLRFRVLIEGRDATSGPTPPPSLVPTGRSLLPLLLVAGLLTGVGLAILRVKAAADA